MSNISDMLEKSSYATQPIMMSPENVKDRITRQILETEKKLTLLNELSELLKNNPDIEKIMSLLSRVNY